VSLGWSVTLSVWNSSWIPTVHFFTPTLLPLSKSSNLDLIVSDLISPNGNWNLPLLVSLFTTPCVKEILKIPISHNISSSFLWTLLLMAFFPHAQLIN
jgi:hypothetical protein